MLPQCFLRDAAQTIQMSLHARHNNCEPCENGSIDNGGPGSAQYQISFGSIDKGSTLYQVSCGSIDKASFRQTRPGNAVYQISFGSSDKGRRNRADKVQLSITVSTSFKHCSCCVGRVPCEELLNSVGFNNILSNMSTTQSQKRQTTENCEAKVKE